MKSNILIFGKGFIGQRLQEEFACAITDRIITTLKDAEEEINIHKPDVIINCIGHTGQNNVDGCELEKDMTLMANSFVSFILAEVALRNKIKLIHISSGCIYHYDFKHQLPITEKETPDFMDLYYSRSKIYSEVPLEILSKTFNILILRIRIPLDNRPHPRNILNKLIRYGKVIDIPNSVTYIPDFIAALKYLISIDARGLYNVVNRGGLRYPDLLNAYKRYVPDFHYEIVDLKTVLETPRTNLILSTRKLEESGFTVRDIKDVLDECVKEVIARNN